MKYVYLSSLLLSFATMSMAGEPVQIAQYQADVDDVVWRVGTEADNTRFGDGVTKPWGLSQQRASTSMEAAGQLGRYRLSSILDIYQHHGFSGAETYDVGTGFTAGPGLSLTPNSITRLFVSLSQEQVRDDIDAARWGGDSATQRTGLRQTWFLARRRAQITLDYGFERGDTEDIYDDRRSHSIVLSSRFPLFWGLSARINADYAHNSYLEYLGINDVNSDKQLFQASINRSFTERLYGEFQFSYLNEKFDDSELSYRRYSWGLNLRYQY